MQSVQSRNNRILSTCSNSSSNSSGSSPSSGKLMSISSIIAGAPMFASSSLTTHKSYHQEAMERRASAPSHPYHHPQRHVSSFFRSPPTSPEDKLFETPSPSSPASSVSSLSPKRYPSQQQSPSYYPHHQQTHHHHHLQHQQKRVHSMMMDDDDDEDMLDDQDPSQPPLTLQERRLRNKAASAKYRQKKNQQQNEMRLMIGQLSEQNAVLERQLQELRLENDRLKATTDRLRGKMVAKKMLKKWIGRQSAENKGNQQAYHGIKNDVNRYPYNDSTSNFNCSILSVSSSSNSDPEEGGASTAAAAATTILDDQDEDDELDSISSE